MNPFLALIPCAFDTGKLYSVLPSDGTGDLTVSRNGTATYVDKDGLLKTAQPNEPRLEFNTDGTFKGVLVEPSATNLFFRSEEFDNSVWIKNNSTVTISSELSPINSNSMLYTCLVLSSNFLNQARSTANTVNTFSIFVKKNIGNLFRLSLGSNNSIFNLDNKSSTNPIGKIVDYGNGWLRLSLTANPGTNTATFISFPITAQNNDSIFIWGAQVEVGSVATSYIRTVASTVTRPADVIRVQEPSGITQIKTINNNIETTTTPTGGLFTLPNGNIKRVLML